MPRESSEEWELYPVFGNRTQKPTLAFLPQSRFRRLPRHHHGSSSAPESDSQRNTDGSPTYRSRDYSIRICMFHRVAIGHTAVVATTVSIESVGLSFGGDLR